MDNNSKMNSEEPDEVELFDGTESDHDIDTDIDFTEENKDPVGEEKGAAEKPAGNAIVDWAQAVAFSVIAVVLLFSFFVRIIGVVGDSMLPTLHSTDRVVISGLFYTPEAGDIVVISKRSQMFPEPIIKRVIATEGQTIRFDFSVGCVWVDGELLEEDYIADRTLNAEHLESGVEYTVPENCVFVMGDNRNSSSDSRHSEIGMVDERYILGRVLLRIYPFDKLGKVD